MKFIVVLSAVLLSVANAAPQGKGDAPIAIVSQNSNLEPDGAYQYSYETANGIKVDETGTVKKASSPDSTDVVISQGSFSYTNPEGQLISVQYVADDVGGFQATGDHLPTPPPIPAAIQKALDYVASIPVSQRQGQP